MVNEENVTEDIINTENVMEEPSELSKTLETPKEQVEEEKPQAKNFRTLRQEKEKIERERDEMMRQLQAIKQKEQSADDEVQLAPDDLVEWKHVEKKIKKLEDKIQTYQQESVLSSTETKLKQQYPDFDSVVSKDNIDALRIAYPEISQTLNDSPDLYNKAISAYTLIKKLGIYKKDTFQGERERVQANSIKPKPLASVSPQKSDSPLSHANAFANGLTEDLKKQLYKEMTEIRKGG